MSVLGIFEGIAAVIAVAAVVFSAGKFTQSVKVNTTATEKLSEVIDGHLKWSAEIVREHDERFHDHDKRISILEGSKRR